jgi:hypothetical protein
MKTSPAFFLLSAILVSILAALPNLAAHAQLQDNRWSPPFRLSSLNRSAGEATLLSDPYGYVHAFWIEDGAPDYRQTIQHARFDGMSWTAPNDMYVSFPSVPIGGISADLGENNTIYFMWTDGPDGPAYLTTAPAHDAMAAWNWTRPVRLPIPAARINIRVDSQGVLHLMYTVTTGREPGLHYTFSEDDGLNWSDPKWLDPDIPLRQSPQVFQFEIDDQDGLHILWYYIDLQAAGGIGSWIRYTHSLDGGKSWSAPFTIDKADEDPRELRLPYPGMIVAGQSVHVIWAGNSFTTREHRYSNDRGVTWSTTNRVFGDLSGQALGDGMAVDGLGRVHFTGQIRYPHGVHYAIWDGKQWSATELVYLIARDAFDEIGARIHAHNVRLAVRAGNQLVLTITDSPSTPNLGLYVLMRTLDDLPADQILATPTPTPIQSPTPVATPPSPTPTPRNELDTGPVADLDSYTPTAYLFWAVLPTILVILGIAFYNFVRKP